jgi:5-methylcytosine-specific restriction enzyme subunit McrC
MGAWQRITLSENRPVRLAPEDFEAAAVTRLQHHYAQQIKVEAPSRQTNGRWQLTVRAWAGLIPLTETLLLELRPELVPANPWHLMADRYAVEPGLHGNLEVATSWLDLYNGLASLLAHKVLERARRGLHRGYVQQSDRLPYIRGQIEIKEILRRPWQPSLKSHYEEHTPDIGDNQILAWTLRMIARSGLCHEPALALVGRAYRTLQRVLTLRPFAAQECTGRSYGRLNQDYRSLHLLCHFFLEHLGPGHRGGERALIPFLVDVST